MVGCFAPSGPGHSIVIEGKDCNDDIFEESIVAAVHDLKLRSSLIMQQDVSEILMDLNICCKAEWDRIPLRCVATLLKEASNGG